MQKFREDLEGQIGLQPPRARNRNRLGGPGPLQQWLSVAIFALF